MLLNTIIKNQVLKMESGGFYTNFNDTIQRRNHPNIERFWTKNTAILKRIITS